MQTIDPIRRPWLSRVGLRADRSNRWGAVKGLPARQWRKQEMVSTFAVARIEGETLGHQVNFRPHWIGDAPAPQMSTAPPLAKVTES